jgi:CSLREA domain-containing protein
MPHHRRLLPFVIALWLLAACGEDQPTTPGSSADGPAYSHGAGDVVVNSAADPGDGVCNTSNCTLREAINHAGSSEITFAPGLAGPITLAPLSSGGGQLLINKPLRITGPADGIIIRRRNADPDSRIFRIGASADVWLTNLIIRNGRLADMAGGGIANDGSLTLVFSTVEGSSAEQGGGIYNHGSLSLITSTISGNSARFGGGIDNHGPLIGTKSTISSNSGGGIYNHNNQTLSLSTTTVGQNSGRGLVNDGGVLRLNNGTVAGNTGGGIAQGRGMATLTHMRVVDNSTPADGGGIWNAGNMTIRNSKVTRNSAADGGGIANDNDGDLTIIRSTVWSNSATGRGGGIFNADNVRGSPSLTATNSTLSGNTAAVGGGIYNSAFLGTASVTLTNTTLSLNTARQEGGGIRQTFDQAIIALRNTIVARNSAPESPDAGIDQEGGVSARFSLIGDGSGSGINNTNGNQVGTSSSPINPRLGPLADNGGPTRTHALLAGSPAIDAASDADCPPRDQRGVTRPQGSGCDIGSYERQ